MTDRETKTSYRDAIDHLTDALAVLNRPDEGLGVAWGLRRGQVGWFYLMRTRNQLERLRDDLERIEWRSAMSAIESLAAVEARLRRNRWRLVTAGADGLGSWRHGARGLGLIHSTALEGDGELWEHVSLSRADRQMPTWEQVRDVFREVCGDDALGVVVVPPKTEHVDIAEVAHVWRCLTRRPLPDFTHGTGSI